VGTFVLSTAALVNLALLMMQNFDQSKHNERKVGLAYM